MTNPPYIPWLDLYRICGQGGGGTIWVAREQSGSGMLRAVKIVPEGESTSKIRQAIADYRRNIRYHLSLIDILF